MDRIITASAARGTVSLVAGITSGLVREARERHDLAPTSSAAVGRLLTAAALLGASLKGRERLTLQIVGDGPIGSITADAWSTGTHAVGARAYARNGRADVPLNALGKFDVARVVGAGKLQVTKTYEVGQPYSGIVPLVSGEIGDDVAAYLGNSEQIPSIVAVGVLADPSGIRAAGGVIAQVQPGADDATVAALERNVAAMRAVTTQIVEGAEPGRARARGRGRPRREAVRHVHGRVRLPLHARKGRVRAARPGQGRAREDRARAAADRSDVRLLRRALRAQRRRRPRLGRTRCDRLSMRG